MTKKKTPDVYKNTSVRRASLESPYSPLMQPVMIRFLFAFRPKQATWAPQYVHLLFLAWLLRVQCQLVGSQCLAGRGPSSMPTLFPPPPMPSSSSLSRPYSGRPPPPPSFPGSGYGSQQCRLLRWGQYLL